MKKKGGEVRIYKEFVIRDQIHQIRKYKESVVGIQMCVCGWWLGVKLID